MHTYQLIARQALSVALGNDVPMPIPMDLDSEFPKVCIRPLNSSEAMRMEHGGTLLAVEFQCDDSDRLRATTHGLGLIEDFLSAVTLASGIPFRDTHPIQLLDATPGIEHRRLLSFLPFEGYLWSEEITAANIDDAQRILLHWEELDTGHRIRRATQRYSRALNTSDHAVAFQHAYMGLEALEKPLAMELKVPVGHEIKTGNCDACGAEFEVKRTVLSGVRAYICGEGHGTAVPERAEEWKRLSRLRTRMTHGLEDPSESSVTAERLLPAVCHHLHDACAHLSHAHHLESPGYRLVRPFGKQFVLDGRLDLKDPPTVVEAGLLLEARPVRWTKHDGVLVPEYEVMNHVHDSLEVRPCVLSVPVAQASEPDLMPVGWYSPA